MPVRSSTFSVTSISIDFRCQSILIVGLNRLIPMISTDFLYRFLSINYVWSINGALSNHIERMASQLCFRPCSKMHFTVYWPLHKKSYLICSGNSCKLNFRLKDAARIIWLLGSLIKQLRRRPQQRLQKNKRLFDQNNSSARASRF